MAGFNFNSGVAKRVFIVVIIVAVILVPLALIGKSYKTTSVTTPDGKSQKSGSGADKTMDSVYRDRFMELFSDIQKKGYLSQEGVPYHSLETLIVEAPDYGHLTTSEAFSFLVWLNATYGKVTGDWSYYKDAWDKTEKYIIPDPAKSQPGVNTYPPSKPAQYAPEADTPSGYPVMGSDQAPVGKDPIADELAGAYGSKAIYQMHWLLDVDNWYKYGNNGDGTSRCSYINTYQRGPQESVWETIPHPSWEEFKWGTGNGGFLSLFGKFGTPAKQWRYSSASDADARQVQASYWALQWAKEQGKDTDIAPYNDKAAKLGDYLRYTFFDKYFRSIGTQNTNKAGTGYDSCHYLLSWYLSWGGDINGSWSWRIGSSYSHQGYQNIVAAYALSSDPALKPKSANGQTDWKKSLERQIELYQYLQSAEGAIAGGVTNSWNGRYDAYPQGTSTFYDMAYDYQPVYHDPPSNNWFGFQAWSMERVIEYYYITGDEKIKSVCDKWVKWALGQVKLNTDGTYEIPSTLEWSGQPDPWTGKPTDNANLHCKVKESGNDVGVAAALAKALIYYAAACEKHQNSENNEARTIAKELLDRMWDKYRDDQGIAVPEKRDDYKRFFDEVYIPKDYTGKNGQGADLKNGMTFIDMRPAYKEDPGFKTIESDVKSGKVPVIKYHRFWAQADIAMAYAAYYIYIEKGATKDASGEASNATSKNVGGQPPATGTYNYGEALQKAIFFYECQRSGKLDAAKLRMNWRGDSGLKDGSDVGLDLTGGWYDAGDHVKFGLPMAYSACMLGWSVYEYKDAFEKSGQLTYILDNIKWATDYFIKCHPKPDEFYYQVGDGNKDHAWWGPAEAMQMDRPAYKIDSSKPGSAVAGETAAALAVASIIFKDSDSSYAEKCLKHAKELFAFAEETKSDAGYTAANGFYNSWSGFYDELSWAATWLYLATKDSSYLKMAESYVSKWGVEPQTTTISYKWAHCWDDVHCGAQLLLARITKKPLYKESMERHLDWWAGGSSGDHVKYTSKGLAWLSEWGSLRYATTEAFLASIYTDWSGCSSSKVSSYKKFAKNQVEYALGSAGRSFVVGYGTNPPEHPHHRTAHGSWADNQKVPESHRHVLYGALVGGPGSDDNYKDDIGDYKSNEVACDYNAGFVGALAKMYLLYGGSPADNFKAVEEKKDDEFFVEAGVNASGNNFTEIKAVLNNRSGWPARTAGKLSFRYYVDLSELKKAGRSAGDVKTGTNYNQGAAVSGLKHLKDDIYYVVVDFTPTKIFPGGQSSYKKEVQFRISLPEGTSGWNPSNDFSYQGLSGGSVVKAENIPVYDDGKKVYGLEPGESKSTEPVKKVSNSLENLVSSPSPVNQARVDVQDNTGNKQNYGSGSIKVQFYNGNISPASNSINASFKLINTGNSAINLSKVKLRYYYTIDGDKGQNFWCDWSSADGSNVTGKFIKLSAKGADYCLEVNFKGGAGTLGPGKDAVVQVRFAKEDWSNYTQTGDYSFNSSSSGYVDWKKVTAYISGKLEWGQEP